MKRERERERERKKERERENEKERERGGREVLLCRPTIDATPAPEKQFLINENK